MNNVLSNCFVISVPGGSLSQDGEKPYTTACIFAAPDTMESMREQEQVTRNTNKLPSTA